MMIAVSSGAMDPSGNATWRGAINYSIMNSFDLGSNYLVQVQGWYNRFQRDEVVAEWKKIKGQMSLHVHCHISGGHFLLDLFAKLRFYIFCKELPVVLKAFIHGDENLLNNYPDLQDALVWVYFHSNIPEFNKVECWGPFRDASSPSTQGSHEMNMESLQPCPEECKCCFPQMSLVPWPQNHDNNHSSAPSSQGLVDQQACNIS